MIPDRARDRLGPSQARDELARLQAGRLAGRPFVFAQDRPAPSPFAARDRVAIAALLRGGWALEAARRRPYARPKAQGAERIMTFSYSAVWAEAVALLRRHASLIATVAGVFIFLPGLLAAYFLPQPEPAELAKLGELWIEYASANWPWLLLNVAASMIGAIAILLLLFARDISVGGAIAAALALLPGYFVAILLSNFVIVLGFLLLIVPGAYALGRLGPLNAVLVAEGHRSPVAAIRRCLEVTRGHGWAIAGLLILVALAASIVVAVASNLLGILFVLAAGRDLGQLLVLIVRAAGSAAMAVLLIVLNAAIYRRLGEGRSAAAASAAD
ncbi:MAG TPA: hypothetical protein VF574_09175 [Allosphingosinicella sp.]